ncbi:MAG TPA: cytochrome b/b6 domain-containing protein [Noviherbaspirillum sp.]
MKIRVWDLPLRLFHWVLVLLLIVSFVTQYVGGNAMDWHFRAGYAVLVLVAFRLIWGFVGPRYARFSSFIYGPSTILGYLRSRQGKQYLGHNPLGSLSVFALLGVVLAQAVTGMFANDDIVNEGPLVRFISKDLSDQLTWIHKDVTAWLLLTLVGLHLLALVWYAVVRKRNLVMPMISGDQEVGAAEVAPQPAQDSWKQRLLALAILTLLSAAMVWLVNLRPTYL